MSRWNNTVCFDAYDAVHWYQGIHFHGPEHDVICDAINEDIDVKLGMLNGARNSQKELTEIIEDQCLYIAQKSHLLEAKYDAETDMCVIKLNDHYLPDLNLEDIVTVKGFLEPLLIGNKPFPWDINN